MAETTTQARPYAKAAFEVALQDSALDHWSAMLALSAAVAGQASVSSVLKDPSLSAAQIAESFIAVCGDELDGKGSNFIRLLADNKRLVLLPEIAALYENLKANQEKSVDVEITAAFEISPDLAGKLAASLRSRLDREVQLLTRVDRSLLGGAIIRAGDTVIDSSVRGKLGKLAETMNS